VEDFSSTLPHFEVGLFGNGWYFFITTETIITLAVMLEFTTANITHTFCLFLLINPCDAGYQAAEANKANG
jgi:hypothetical protein